MGSFDERVKTKPRIKVEAGEYVIIESTKNGITISEVAISISEIAFNIHSNGLIESIIKINASDIGKNKTCPMRTKVTLY